MADAAMASVPLVGAAVGGLPTGGLEALKYAAQADMFQDDPNFFTWLEDWIGKGDEESNMMDAFNTLTDYGMQFEFQQQQQQQQQEVSGLPSDSGLTAGTGAVPSGKDAFISPQQQQQQQQYAQMEVASGIGSACASLTSHPSSQPSNSSSITGLASPSSSSLAAQSCGQQYLASLAASPSLLVPGPTAATAPAAAAASSSGAASAASPFDSASFSLPLSRGLDALGLPLELSALLSRPSSSTEASGCPAGSIPDIPSHGTVMSYIGTQPPAAPAAVAGNLPGAEGAGVGLSGGSRGPHVLNIPSLGQLIARVICGNGVGGAEPGRKAAAAAAGGSLSQAVLGSGGGGGGGGGEPRYLSTSGCGGSGGIGTGSVNGASIFVRNSSGSLGGGVAGGSADCSMDGDSPSASGRQSTLEGEMAMYLGYRNPHDYHHHHHQQQQQQTPRQQQQQQQEQQQQQQHMSESYWLSSTGGSGGGGTAGVRHHWSRHKNNTPAPSGLAHAHPHGRSSCSHHHHHLHHHHHSIPVSQTHPGHTHVGKAVAAAGAAAGGLSASGKPTRSARAKAVFAALEAEVAGKISELEALQHENATLTQRVEILEVAVERQSAILSLMTTAAAAAAAEGRTTAVGSVTAAAAPPSSLQQNVGSAGGKLLAAGPELLDWARTCTLEMYVAWYKEHLQEVSLALLATENSATNPEAEMRLVQLVASAWLRTSLVCIFQPLTQLRLKGLNLETNLYSEPPEQHWMEVIKFMTVSAEQVAEMENLFHSYNLLHGSFRAELQDTQRELSALVGAQDWQALSSRKMCSGEGLALLLQQTALLKRVRNILQKTHLLYSSTIGVAAMRILKPKEFAKCSVQSYPYYPCGPSLMKACAQLRAMAGIWGAAAVGCAC